MSKRFGRNQKRRMREALAAAEAWRLQENVGRIAAEGIAREATHKLNRLREHMADFIGRVGRYAIAEGVPVNFEADFLGRTPRFRMAAKQELSVLALDFLSTASMMSTATVCAEVMYALDVEAVRDHMARDMHCRLYFDEHQVGYAISEHAVRHMTSEELARRIAPEMTSLLLRELKGKVTA